MSVDAFDSEDSAIRCPPDLALDRFVACAAIEREIGGWGAHTLGRARGGHVQLVWAEAWLSHLDEGYVTRGCRPFRGDENVYIERLVVEAAAHIQAFLSAHAQAWRPKAEHPQFGGRLHRAVDYLVRRRIEANGGGCEQCHADVHLELHHLRYDSFGRELAPDVMKLCRPCHRGRHWPDNWPQDATWRDKFQWPL